ncbi:MAG: hypothetical protein KJT03_02220, partial [Verrucomicrobiae bacterium]|nr:hypothetical protein [Verrucomicrobiae bacterium]
MPAVRPPSSFLFYSVYLFGAVTLVFADPNAPVTYQVLLSEDSAVVNDGGDNWEAAAFPKYGPDGTGWVVADWSGIENDFPVGGVGLTVLSGLNEITVQYRERDRGFSGMRQNLIFPTSSGLVFGATPEGDTWQSIYSGNPPQVIEVDGLLEYAGFEGSVVFGDVLPGFKTNFSVIRPNLVTIKLGEIGEAVPGLEGVTFAEFGKINVSNAGHVAFFAKMQGSGIDS